MPANGRVSRSALALAPPTAATTTSIAIKLAFHDTAFSCVMGVAAGLLALMAVIALSDQAQATIRTWLEHRVEHRKAATEQAVSLRWIRAATCGRRWTSRGATDVRASALAITPPADSLLDVMRVTRRLPISGTQASQGAPAAKALSRPTRTQTRNLEEDRSTPGRQPSRPTDSEPPNGTAANLNLS
jgi:hypothetical protein